MASLPAKARESRLSFCTDMTKSSASVIPLGYMLEAVWPDEARWLGLIGRTKLMGHELELVNLATWPDLEKPFTFLDKVFDQGWGGEWGNAGVIAQSVWLRSPLLVVIDDNDDLLKEAEIDSEAGWTSVTDMLAARLTMLGQKLRPLMPPTPSVGLAPIRPFPRRADIPLRFAPHGRRMFEEFANVA